MELLLLMLLMIIKEGRSFKVHIRYLVILGIKGLETAILLLLTILSIVQCQKRPSIVSKET